MHGLALCYVQKLVEGGKSSGLKSRSSGKCTSISTQPLEGKKLDPHDFMWMNLKGETRVKYSGWQYLWIHSAEYSPFNREKYSSEQSMKILFIFGSALSVTEMPSVPWNKVAKGSPDSIFSMFLSKRTKRQGKAFFQGVLSHPVQKVETLFSFSTM